MLPIYALPFPAVSHRVSKTTKKRKRKEKLLQDEGSDNKDSLQPVEYSAVVTPEERVQRRLAGQPLNENPPPYPFPHVPVLDKYPSEHATPFASQESSNASLRVQHLAAMTALLHKCLADREYKRASRALALILRTEIHGKTIDLRNAGLWGVGAELLLRTTSEPSSNAITRDGFEKAKLFYDRMSLQHPWHRSWPDAVNVQDFKIAFFGLWIYVVDEESRRLQELDSSGLGDDRELLAKEWELAEAEKITRALDTLMSTLPFMDDLELVRLRAMIALWTADLIDTTSSLRDESADPELKLERAWMGNADFGEYLNAASENPQAEAARAIARKMFAKLNTKEKGEDSDTNPD